MREPFLFSNFPVVTDERVTPWLGYCLYCRQHEGSALYIRLLELTPWARQCQLCKRLYIVAEPKEELDD